MQTFSSLHGRKKQSPGIKTIEVFIPTYQLEWERLKEWLDKRFESYKMTFTERHRIVNDKYAVCLPEDLTTEDRREIAMLKTE